MSFPDKIIREEIRSMSAYHVPSSAGMIKLDAMENPYALPAALRREIAEIAATAQINRYPDPQAPALTKRLREVMSVPHGMDILLGNGSDEIIQMMIQACGRRGAVIMAPSPTFAMYRQYAIVAGLEYVGVPLAADFSLDLASFLSAMEEHQPAVIFISYPNNPTGNLFDESVLTEIIRRAPGLVVMDEAYQAFAGRTFMNALAEYPNLVLLRTVSKLGLAGLRLGYAVGRPEWIREFDKVRSPYNVNVLTQLVAVKVLEHCDVLESQASAIIAERARLADALSALPCTVAFPSRANFVLARVPDAKQLTEHLRQSGILVKSMHGMHVLLTGCVRFTVGTPEENTRLIDSLKQLAPSQRGV